MGLNKGSNTGSFKGLKKDAQNAISIFNII